MDTSLEFLTINETHSLLKAVLDARDKAIITMFLNTGIFVNELIDLKNDDINFEQRIITITGHRSRQIAINEEHYEALVKWTKERLDTPDSHFFITNKGKVQNLSVRSIDKMIRKYAKQLGRNVNAKILRNTFAVHLFAKDISNQNAADILGISDPESIKRYRAAAKAPMTIQNLDHLDTRSKPLKWINQLFAGKPKPIKKRPAEIPRLITDEILLGRDSVLKEIMTSLTKTQPILLTGQLGIGKTQILKHIVQKESAAIWISSPIPIKDMLKKIDATLYPETAHSSRTSTREILEHIVHNANANFPLLIIDDLNNIKASDLPIILTLLEHCPILAAAENTEPRLKQLWWKFKIIELEPLDNETCKTLIRYSTQSMSIRDYELMETKLLNSANGIPLSLTDTIKQLSYDSIVTEEAIRNISHDAGLKYRDWTPAIIILWALLIMSRFIALGTHSFEGYILVGFGTSFFLVVKYFMGRMK
jgi:DNA replication protein DnaC